MLSHKFSDFLTRPKYWPQLTSFAFAWTLGHLPTFIQLQIANIIGWLMLTFSGRHRKIVEINLRACFPEKSEHELSRIIHRNAYMMGRGVVEASCCWYTNLASRNKNTQVIGGEHLEAALAEGKGVILLGLHATSLEISALLLGHHYEIWGMYKPNKNPLIEFMMCKGRLRHLKGLIKQNDVRGMVKALKNNKVIWYASDQDYGRNKSTVFAPFFNIQTSTITATTKFAKMTGAAVVPFTHHRVNHGKGYVLEIHPAMENFPGKDEVEDATRTNLFIENHIKKNPADYVWVHKRFKTRPEGEKPFYPSKS